MKIEISLFEKQTWQNTTTGNSLKIIEIDEDNDIVVVSSSSWIHTREITKKELIRTILEYNLVTYATATAS